MFYSVWVAIADWKGNKRFWPCRGGGQRFVPLARVRRHSEFVGGKCVINTINQMHIHIPDGEFTINELEKANPQVPSEIVVTKLANAIFERSVEFVSGCGQNPVTYRKRENG